MTSRRTIERPLVHAVRLFAGAAVISVMGCGGGAQPASASAAEASDIVVRSGPDGGPLPGVPVQVAGTLVQTDSQGRLPGPVPLGAELRIDTAGSLPRQTWASGQEVVLWPDGTALPRSDTFDIVYRDAPAQQLTRVQTSRVALRLSSAVAADAEARAAIGTAAARMSEVTGVRYDIDPNPPSSAVVFDVDLDPGLQDPVLGHTSVRSRAGVVTGGRVSFRTLAAARRVNTTLHELGHTFGLLGHSADPRNVMYASSSDVTDFSPVERAILAMMLRRQPGNRFPDIDAAAPATASVSSVASVQN